MSDWIIDPWILFGGGITIDPTISCTQQQGGAFNENLGDPGGAENGDVVLMILLAHNEDVENIDWVVGGSHWNELVTGFRDTNSTANDNKFEVWWRFKDAGDPATTNVTHSNPGANGWMSACLYTVKNVNADRPFIQLSNGDEGTGSNEHYAPGLELQDDQLVIFFAGVGSGVTVDAGLSTLPGTVLKDGSSEDGWFGYDIGAEAAGEIKEYMMYTTGGTNFPWATIVMNGVSRVDIGGQTRPAYPATIPTPDFDGLYVAKDDTGQHFYVDKGKTTRPDFRYRPSTSTVEVWDDQSGNGNDLLSPNLNSTSDPRYMTEAGLQFGARNPLVGSNGQTTFNSRLLLPQFAATVTRLEMFAIVELGSFDTSANDGRPLFFYNEDSFHVELQHNESSQSLSAIAYNVATVTGTATVGVANVPTLPHGRVCIHAAWEGGVEATIRVSGFEDTVAAGTIAERTSGLVQQRVWSGDTSGGANRDMRTFLTHELLVWANQTALSGAQISALETYAFNEYGVVDRS